MYELDSFLGEEKAAGCAGGGRSMPLGIEFRMTAPLAENKVFDAEE